MTHAFTVVLRGYDRPQVDRLLTQADQALASGSETARLAALHALNGPRPGVSFRGYDRAQVDRALTQRRNQLGAPSPVGPSAVSPDHTSGPESDHRGGTHPNLRAGAHPDLRGNDPGLRGVAYPDYDYLGDRAPSPTGRPAPPGFTVVLRGYAVPEVDKLFTQVDEALASGGETSRAAARQALAAADFPVSLRGYDRRQVDQLIESRLRLLAEAG